MKLFILLSRVPFPTEKGDKLRAYHQIIHLSKYHTITLCALADKKVHSDAIQKLQPYCNRIEFIRIKKSTIFINIIKSFFSGLPLQVGYFYNKKTKEKIHQLINETKPNHIYCQLIRMAEYVKDLSIPKTLDYQDAFSKGIERRIAISNMLMKPLLWLEYYRVLNYEKKIFDFFTNKTIITEQDRNFINHPKKIEIHIVSNGVDIKYFEPNGCNKEYDILFTGNMSYPPNVASAEFIVNEILPIVKKRFPHIKVLFAGSSPTLAVKKLQNNNVFITGWVDDIRKCYKKSRIFLAPMQISIGLQNKLLEAMAMKLPCITSSLANNALQATHGKEILIGQNVWDYAYHVITLLEEPNKAEELALNGYNFVLKNYNWETATNKLNDIICSTTPV